MTLKIGRCAFENSKFTADSVYLSENYGCGGVLIDDFYVYDAFGGDCGTEVVNNGTHIIYSNVVHGNHFFSVFFLIPSRVLPTDFQNRIWTMVQVTL